MISMIRNYDGRFQRFIMSFSFSERRSKQLEQYRQTVSEFKQMQSDELDFEYITLKSRYEHKKNVLMLFILTITLAVLMDVWNSCLHFMEKAFQYVATLENGGIEVAKIGFIISAIAAISIVCVVSFILISYMKELRMMSQKLMIIEEVKNQRANE